MARFRAILPFLLAGVAAELADEAVMLQDFDSLKDSDEAPFLPHKSLAGLPVDKSGRMRYKVSNAVAKKQVFPAKKDYRDIKRQMHPSPEMRKLYRETSRKAVRAGLGAENFDEDVIEQRKFNQEVAQNMTELARELPDPFTMKALHQMKIDRSWLPKIPKVHSKLNPRKAAKADEMAWKVRPRELRALPDGLENRVASALGYADAANLQRKNSFADPLLMTKKGAQATMSWFNQNMEEWAQQDPQAAGEYTKWASRLLARSKAACTPYGLPSVPGAAVKLAERMCISKAAAEMGLQPPSTPPFLLSLSQGFKPGNRAELDEDEPKFKDHRDVQVKYAVGDLPEGDDTSIEEESKMSLLQSDTQSEDAMLTKLGSALLSGSTTVGDWYKNIAAHTTEADAAEFLNKSIAYYWPMLTGEQRDAMMQWKTGNNKKLARGKEMMFNRMKQNKESADFLQLKLSKYFASNFNLWMQVDPRGAVKYSNWMNKVASDSYNQCMQDEPENLKECVFNKAQESKEQPPVIEPPFIQQARKDAAKLKAIPKVHEDMAKDARVLRQRRSEAMVEAMDPVNNQWVFAVLPLFSGPMLPQLLRSPV